MILEKVKIVFKNNREYNFNHGYSYTTSIGGAMFIWGVLGVWYISPPPPTIKTFLNEENEAEVFSFCF